MLLNWGTEDHPIIEPGLVVDRKRSVAGCPVKCDGKFHEYTLDLSANPDWKKGFYFIAQKANIPILLYGVDYERRLIECTKTVIANGDVEAQMREIKQYFTNFKGKHPENFTIGEV